MKNVTAWFWLLFLIVLAVAFVGGRHCRFGGYDDEIKDFLRRIKPNVNPATILLYLKSENINSIQGYFNDFLFKA